MGLYASELSLPAQIAATLHFLILAAEDLDAHCKARQEEHSTLTLTQMYNVLVKLKAGEALNAEDERIKEQFPTGEELAETVEVMRVLETATQPVSIGQIASHFAQGKAIEKRVGLVIAALARLGHLASGDGGNSFSLRSAA